MDKTVEARHRKANTPRRMGDAEKDSPERSTGRSREKSPEGGVHSTVSNTASELRVTAGLEEVRNLESSRGWGMHQKCSLPTGSRCTEIQGKPRERREITAVRCRQRRAVGNVRSTRSHFIVSLTLSPFSLEAMLRCSPGVPSSDTALSGPAMPISDQMRFKRNVNLLSPK